MLQPRCIKMTFRSPSSIEESILRKRGKNDFGLNTNFERVGLILPIVSANFAHYKDS